MPMMASRAAISSTPATDGSDEVVEFAADRTVCLPSRMPCTMAASANTSRKRLSSTSYIDRNIHRSRMRWPGCRSSQISSVDEGAVTSSAPTG